MKKILYVITIIILSACSNKKSMNNQFIGHWISEDFYTHISEHKNLIDYSGEKIEFIIPDNDTNYTLVNFNGKINSGPLELMKQNQLVIKNYFGNYKNADILLNGDKLEFINNETGEKLIFRKLSEDDLNTPKNIGLSSYTIPFINKNYIAGNYLMGSDTVQFSNLGNITNLGAFVNFSFCLTESCRNSNNNNTIFLSNKNNEGNYYEYSTKGDYLIIYEIDIDAFNRGSKAGNIGIKYQLKKIN